MTASPLADLVDALQTRRCYGWLSIGATLLEGSTGAQHKMSRHAKELLDAPASNGNGRSYTVPLTGTVNRAEGWLMVWATRPVAYDSMKCETNLREYLQAKKHQMGIPRGAVLLYDEGTRDLVDVFYDGHIGELTDELSARLGSLRPAGDLQARLHPNAKKRAPKGRQLR